MKQNVRIIGGNYRGKKLHFPDIEGLRPTPDRVRETVFNWLMHEIREANCLDAFAGSGALGFEAFSRGAAQVTLIEQSPLAFNHLKKTIAEFNSPKLKVINENALDYLKKTKEQFNIIFLDPPFSQDIIPQSLDIISQNKILATDGLIYIESPIEIQSDEWEPIKLKKAGQVFYGLYKVKISHLNL